VAAIAGEDEELRGGEGEDFAFRGCTGVLVFTRLFAPPSYLSVQAPLTAKVGGGVRRCTAVEKRHIPQCLWWLGAEANVVVYQTRVAVRRLLQAAVLDECALEEGVQVDAFAGGCEGLFARPDLGVCLHDGSRCCPGAYSGGLSDTTRQHTCTRAMEGNQFLLCCDTIKLGCITNIGGVRCHRNERRWSNRIGKQSWRALH
jgi:hypothetical protein